MALKTPTSILLLSILVAGILSPPGLCAIMCERRSRAETQQHCSQAVDPMPGMMHHHSAMMSYPDVDVVMSLWAPRSCPANCDAAERLNLSRTSTPVKVIYSRIGVPDTTANFRLSDPAAVWHSDGGPPTPHTAFAATFSILRI